jgi:hypothetical protein
MLTVSMGKHCYENHMRLVHLMCGYKAEVSMLKLMALVEATLNSSLVDEP